MVGHEKTDAHVSTITKYVIGLALLVAVSLALMWAMFAILAGREQAGDAPTPMEAQRVVPPAPRLEINEALDLQQLRKNEDEVLGSYGWVNKQAGVVRIPIDRAMELLVERNTGEKK